MRLFARKRAEMVRPMQPYPSNPPPAHRQFALANGAVLWIPYSMRIELVGNGDGAPVYAVRETGSGQAASPCENVPPKPMPSEPPKRDAQ